MGLLQATSNVLTASALTSIMVASITNAIAVLNIAVSRKTAREINQEKLRGDLQLAEKRFAFDKAIVTWRRRYELAEQVLTAAYEARDALNWARARVILSGEGETRQKNENEGDELQKKRNSYFVPLERLSRSANIFATLETLRYTVSAHFGQQAIDQISAFSEVHRTITSTAAVLIDQASVDDDPIASKSLMPLRTILWGNRPDAIDKKIDEAIVAMEALLKPVLSEPPPA